MGKNKMICILGPTAGGKTSLAAHVAKATDGEIISADSRQVYKEMDLGTGKDLKDYVVDGMQIPFHLINIVDPGYEYNVYEFQRDFLHAYNNIVSRNKKVILCGGSGMYLDAILKGYRLGTVPENTAFREKLNLLDRKKLIEILKKYRPLHNVTDVSDRKRLLRAIEIEEHKSRRNEQTENFPKIESLNFGIKWDRAIIKKRITERLKARLQEGMPEEVESLLRQGVKKQQLLFYGLEYKYITQYLCGEYDYDTMFAKLNTAIHQFSKRQMTFFRRMEKQGIHIHWLDGMLSMPEKVNTILAVSRQTGIY